MKKLNDKGITHVLLLVAIAIGIGAIAYASYTQILNVSGTGTASGNFNVAITSISRTSATGVTDNTAPSFTGTSATFNANLAYPGATATYDVTVTNSGSIPAKLSSITDLTTLNSAAPAYITYATSGVTANTTTLAASGGTNVLSVTVTWNGTSSPNTTTGNSKTATITLNYDQNTP
jgi:hypothetical protein